MQLKDWMKKNDRNAVWVGNQIKEPSYQIRRICNGSGLDATIIFKIERLTNGEVNINDWVKLEKTRKK